MAFGEMLEKLDDVFAFDGERCNRIVLAVLARLERTS